jgi:hypothetical protein
VIVTRGTTPLAPILNSLVWDEVVVWDNSRSPDLGAFGRVAGILLTDKPVIYVQDDDHVIEPEAQLRLLTEYQPGVLTANMPKALYREADATMPWIVWQGWGAIYDRDLPSRALARWGKWGGEMWTHDFLIAGWDTIFGVLVSSRRLDYDGAEPLPHADSGTSTLDGDGARKARFYHEAVRAR